METKHKQLLLMNLISLQSRGGASVTWLSWLRGQREVQKSRLSCDESEKCITRDKLETNMIHMLFSGSVSYEHNPEAHKLDDSRRALKWIKGEERIECHTLPTSTNLFITSVACLPLSLSHFSWHLKENSTLDAFSTILFHQAVMFNA